MHSFIEIDDESMQNHVPRTGIKIVIEYNLCDVGKLFGSIKSTSLTQNEPEFELK